MTDKMPFRFQNIVDNPQNEVERLQIFRSTTTAVACPDPVTITAVKSMNHYELVLEIDGEPRVIDGFLFRRIKEIAGNYGYEELDQLVGTRLIGERSRSDKWWIFVPDPASYK